MVGEEKKPLTLSVYFEEFRSNIEPPGNRLAIAAEIPGDVRNYLMENGDFETVDPHSRLTGSYRRRTAVHNIRDVDFLVFVGYEGKRPEPADVLKALRAALDDLPEAVGYGGRAQTLRGQRRSIHIEFDGEDFHLDVVPALVPDGTDNPLLVPDREWGNWVKSDPLGYGRALSKLNAANGEKVVPLVKMVKHWRTFQMQRNRPKSYWLEVLVFRHIDKGWVATAGKSDAKLFTDFLRSVRGRFQEKLDDGGVPKIPDPMLGNDVAFNWERPAFELFMRRLEESIGWAERAMDKDRDQVDEAVTLWQKVFGEEHFTDSPVLRKRQKAELLGTVYVDPAGGVSGKKPKGDKGVKSPKHGFYGDEG
jgi:Second Messenger Oligonucleotide or Dinucleotide Synthetase domain